MTKPIKGLNDVEKQILETVRMLPIRVENSTNTEWTAAAKNLIGNLGISLGWKICASCNNEEFENEWLYDLVWYKDDREHELLDVGLVLECEWDQNYRGIRYDFEKLLLSKSEYKVMIFQGDARSISMAFTKMKLSIEKFRQKSSGERYLLIALNYNEDEFQELHIVVR